MHDSSSSVTAGGAEANGLRIADVYPSKRVSIMMFHALFEVPVEIVTISGHQYTTSRAGRGAQVVQVVL
jgi:hypothetical protein